MYADFLNTLKGQNTPCEIIGIDNRGNNAFTSCAAAYNSVINHVDTEYVIFSHQDILLTDANSLGNFLSYLQGLGHDDILGVAGTKFDSGGIYSGLTHKGRDGKLSPAGRNHIDGGIMECDTADECFFGGHTEHFRDYPFDAQTCNGWHLYAAELCIRGKAQAIGKTYICAVPIMHLSYGNINLAFYRDFFRLCRKYSGKLPVIRTTCAFSRTDLFHLLPRFIYLCGGVILRKFGLYNLVKKLLH